jgi:hypothetical protein
MRHSPSTKRLRELLLREWDPLGIAQVPQAQDEYDAFLGGILQLVSAEADLDAVQRYLIRIEEVELGTRADPVRARQAATEILRDLRNS